MMERVTLVTGAARGIGLGVARRLRDAGWQVVGADVTPFAEPGIRAVQTDVADEAAVAALVEGVRRAEGRLDGLVSNAGVMVRKPVTSLSLAEWRRVIDTNLTAAFLLARAAAPLLAGAPGGGGLVLVGSSRARQSEKDTESYAASKGGLVALAHALAVSLGPAVRVNCVSPGWIETRGETLRPEDHAQHPAGRVGTVDDVAALVAWLLGPDAGFVTGAEFVVDGGMTRKMIYAE